MNVGSRLDRLDQKARNLVNMAASGDELEDEEYEALAYQQVRISLILVFLEF